MDKTLGGVPKPKFIPRIPPKRTAEAAPVKRDDRLLKLDLLNHHHIELDRLSKRKGHHHIFSLVKAVVELFLKEVHFSLVCQVHRILCSSSNNVNTTECN